MVSSQKENPLAPTTRQLEEADKAVGIVQIVSGKTEKGEDFYAYISIKPSLFEEFVALSSRSGNEVNLEDYGDVLKKGFGKEPSAAVMKEMEEKYGVDHNFTANLEQEIRKFQDKQK